MIIFLAHKELTSVYSGEKESSDEEFQSGSTQKLSIDASIWVTVQQIVIS